MIVVQQGAQHPGEPFARPRPDRHEPIPAGWATEATSFDEVVYDPAAYEVMRILDDPPARTVRVFAELGWRSIPGDRQIFFLRPRTPREASRGLDEATVALAEGYDDGWHRRIPERRTEASRGDAAEIHMYGWQAGVYDQRERRSYGWRLQQIKIYADDLARQQTASRLTPYQRVRWKPGGRWLYGHLGAEPVAADGSLLVFADYNGAARSLRPDDVEIEVAGPRGGRRWEPATAPGQEPVTRCAMPGCIDRDPGERGVANWVYRNLGDELIPSCWTHVRDAYWWQVKPISEASLPPETPALASAVHRHLTQTARQNLGRSL